MSKKARTAIPVHAFIAERWSPRAFDETSVMSNDELKAMLEAARWAPSAKNIQPWRFAVARRGEPLFGSLHAALMPGNQRWAHRASALVVAATDTLLPSGEGNAWAAYDLGLAVSLLTVQAHAMGLHVHQIGGFNAAAVSTLLELPEQITPLVVLAIGRATNPDVLEDAGLQDRERSTRERMPLEELVLVGLEQGQA